MDAYDCIVTKLEVREFDANIDVASEIRLKILESARLTGSSLNTQPWRFIVVQNLDNLKKLSDDSTSGKWVSGANFAIIVITNPYFRFHLIDAGKVVQNMQLAAWNFGVGSALFTGINEQKMREDFAIPLDYKPVIVVGFGYPKKKITGKTKKKNRLPMNELVSFEEYGMSTNKNRA
ncbi:MAG TPA: nitroreductase family protein [Candidatus Saccharimonadales bacterium]|nr:nitroreductase family protein [Candidatus Saccharimonadales bacterium]